MRLMRFSPQGNLLAIMGSGPIELWDPVALNLVAVTVDGEQEQAIDMAFAPDGRTLAAVSRAGEAMLWTVHDSAVRTQLSGFDNWPASLAFSDDGVLAGVSAERRDLVLAQRPLPGNRAAEGRGEHLGQAFGHRAAAS